MLPFYWLPTLKSHYGFELYKNLFLDFECFYHHGQSFKQSEW